MPDDPSPYRPVNIGPIPADLLDAGGFVDLVATYGPEGIARETLAALTAYQRSTGIPDPIPGYLDPLDAAALTRDILTWWRAREGDGPWCSRCPKTAECRRHDGSLYCFGCTRSVPGVYYPIDHEDGHA